MRNGVLFLWVLFSTTGLAAQTGGLGPKLLAVIHKGDVSAVHEVLRDNADPSSHDETGATALMYAAAFSSPECMRLLIAKGADVDGANQVHATALMWSVAEPEKVKILLAKNADVHVRTDDGQTALLLAARRGGNIESVRLLLAHGADPKAVDRDGVGLLRIAYDSGDAALEQAARGAGLECIRLEQLGKAPLLAALGSGDKDLIDTVFRLGVNPNELTKMESTRLPSMGVLAFDGATAPIQVMLEHGANPNVRGDRGITPLMMAAAADKPDLELVRLLVQKGADINALDQSGRTVLDWALTQGETGISRFLRSAGAKSTPLPPSPAAVAQPRDARAALEALFPRLQPISKTFFAHYGCISCHAQSLPAVAVDRARSHGVTVDAEMATHPGKATMAMWAPFRESLMQGHCGVMPGFVANVSYGLFSLADEGFQPNRNTDAAALCLARLQRNDGSWNIQDIRPPLGNSAIKFTALTIRGLSVYLPAGRHDELKLRIERAREFFRTSHPEDTQDLAFLLLGMRWAGMEKEIAPVRDRLLYLQRDDGGWSQLPSMASDAYATGHALHALHAGGALPVADSAYRKGVSFLLRTQLEDGTWYVRSRAFGFQPYFDAGFPHGPDQFISAAASSWAAIALAYSLEPSKRTAR
jgi:ankyrin repeat protein